MGAAVGTAVQLALPRLLKAVLPVDVAWSVSWPSVLGGIGIGVWVAFLFSLLPLLAVRRVSPLAVLRRDYEEDAAPRRDLARHAAALALAASLVALAVIQAGRLSFGLAFAAGVGVAVFALWLCAFLLVRGLRRFFPRRLPYLYRQGLANLYRPANQTLMVVLALGFGAFLLSTLLLVQHNLLRDLRVDRGRLAPERRVLRRAARPAGRRPAPGERGGPAHRPRRADHPHAPPVAQGPRRRASCSRSRTRRCARSAGRCAASTAAASATRPRPPSGSWRAPGGARASGRAARATLAVPVALEAGLARELRVGIGDEIVWDVQGVPVPSRVAVLREVQWARFEPNFFVVFPEGPLDAAPRSYVLLSRVDDPAGRARLQRSVVEAHPNVSSLDLTQVQRTIEGVLDKVALAVRFMALFSLAAGAVVLAGAVAASRYQRVREGALLRTLGARRSQLLRILLTEYAVLGALAAAGGDPPLDARGLGARALRVRRRASRCPGPRSSPCSLGVLALTVVVGLLGSTEVWRRPPLEVLRAE